MVWPGRRRLADVDRAQRTARLAEDGWVLPWGIGRQVDHATAAFVPRLEGEGLVNRSGRRWTLVGPTGGPAATVDPAGLVTPQLGGWSLDWWVGADDRWRLPSREPTVRQALIESCPVVETTMRVPGGEAVHRCFGVPGFWVVEVENRSPSPFALALSIRPYDPLGATTVESVAVEGREVLVDGRTALVLSAPPGRAAASTGVGGDVAAVVVGGGAGLPADLAPERPGEAGSAAPVVCRDGLASVAVVVPVAHRATVRAVIPLDGARGSVEGLPSAAAAVRGWQAQCPGRTGLRVEVPDAALQRAFDAARRSLLLVECDDPGPAQETALIIAALARTGRHTEADDLVRCLWSRQRTDGSFDEPTGGGAPGGPHLWALGEHLRLRPDPGLAAALDRGLAGAAGWLADLDRREALCPTDRRWAAAGCHVAAQAAGAAELTSAAAVLFAGAALFGGAAHLAEAAPALPADATATVAHAASAATAPGGAPRATSASAGAAAAAGAAPVVAPSAASAASLLGLVHRTGGRSGTGPAVAGPAGFDVLATVAAAASELAAGERAGLDRLAWLLGAGEPTGAWPDHLHPRTGSGSGGRGHSPAVTAAFLILVRDLLLVEPADGHVDLLPLLPDAWLGQPIQVDGAVLAGGVRLSFAVRWHGHRPALLWETSSPVRLRAPGLDPSFSTTQARGEALLHAVSTTPGTVEFA